MPLNIYFCGKDEEPELISTLTATEIKVLTHLLTKNAEETEGATISMCMYCTFVAFRAKDFYQLVASLRRNVLEMASEQWGVGLAISSKYMTDRAIATKILNDLFDATKEFQPEEEDKIVFDEMTHPKCSHEIIRTNKDCPVCDGQHKYWYRTTLEDNKEIYCCYSCHQTKGGEVGQYIPDIFGAANCRDLQDCKEDGHQEPGTDGSDGGHIGSDATGS